MEQARKYRPTAVADLNEYFLLAYADSYVNKKVAREAEILATYYEQQVLVNSIPSLTIAHFTAKEVMEDTILRYMQRIFSARQSFKVELNNYSGAPPHTIYLRVQDVQPFSQLAKELKVIDHYIGSCSCPPVQLFSKPHLSITTGLTENVFLKAMFDYSQKTFHEAFWVSELVLVRKNHQYDPGKKVHVFHLQPPVTSPAMSFN